MADRRMSGFLGSLTAQERVALLRRGRRRRYHSGATLFREGERSGSVWVVLGLRALRERGLIETHRRGITILNRDALRLNAT